MAIGVKQILDYDDYAAIPPDGKRWELLEGDVHVTPAPSPRHQWASKKLQRQLEDYFEGRGLGRVVVCHQPSSTLTTSAARVRRIRWLPPDGRAAPPESPSGRESLRRTRTPPTSGDTGCCSGGTGRVPDLDGTCGSARSALHWPAPAAPSA